MKNFLFIFLFIFTRTDSFVPVPYQFGNRLLPAIRPNTERSATVDKEVFVPNPTTNPTRSDLILQRFKLSQLGPTDEVGNRVLLQINYGSISAELVQKNAGVVPRVYLPATLQIRMTDNGVVHENSLYSVVEEGFRWFVDNGGRIGRLSISGSKSMANVLATMGCSGLSVLSDRDMLYSCEPEALMLHCRSRVKKKEGNIHTLLDLIGRLEHDVGDPNAAIKSYTAALQINPKSAETFRNLGSAYHATGDMQMAFASFQQSIQLDTADAAVYLRLAFFYEDLSSREWDNAGSHSQECYQYYLNNVDPEDTSVLTRLGNLLIREHKPAEAAKAFQTALQVDDTMYNIWFNLAHAQVNMKDTAGARESLTRALALKNDLPAAQHMLKALSSEAEELRFADTAYIRDLYNSYAASYDTHGKKLRYASPRVIREEMAKIYKATGRFQGDGNELGTEEDEGGHSCAPSTMGSSEGGCSSHAHVQLTAGPLDVLDLGCGTGLAGGWVKDYCKTLVGVDLSEEMIKAAKKKQLYQELKVMSINDYMRSTDRQFDLVIAADVLSYIGDLSETIQQVPKMLKSGTHFVFTLEALPSESNAPKGFRLLSNGRFGYKKSYIDDLVALNGFEVVMSRDFSPRLDYGEPVPGFMYILTKK